MLVDYPVYYVFRLRRETYSYFYYIPTIRLVWNGVTTAVNLVKSLLCCSIDFQLKT